MGGDRMKKKVNFVIEVPDSNFCWTYDNLNAPCWYFDNSSGNCCDLGFRPLKEDDDGVIKAPECAVLKIYVEN